MDVAAMVRDGRMGYLDGVRAGMYRPLGRGDLRIEDIVCSIEDAGYEGWYVLEQDTTLAGPPARGEGPFGDAKVSVGFLRRLAAGRGGRVVE